MTQDRLNKAKKIEEELTRLDAVISYLSYSTDCVSIHTKDGDIYLNGVRDGIIDVLKKHYEFKTQIFENL